MQKSKTDKEAEKKNNVFIQFLEDRKPESNIN